MDLSALEHNLQTAASRTAASILPILKSDAYGHGAPVV
ncbi:alanine racemase, partial [Candidatus Darwinibacter acetoxidans]